MINYYVRCDFTGYRSVADGTAPAFYPAAGSNGPSTYLVRSSASAYSTVTAVVNGQAATTARLLADHLWQSVVNLAATTNSLTVSWNGYARTNSTGGYSTNTVTWGQPNSWQTNLPLSDNAATNLGPIVISGSFSSGQYVIRFDEQSGQYLVIPCVWQDFDNWSDTGGQYVLQNNNANVQNLRNNFDSWATNITRVRAENFSGDAWAGITTYTNEAAGGGDGYIIFGSKMSTTVGNPAWSVQTTNVTARGQSFVVQPSHWGNFPLRGIGTISYQYQASTTSPVSSVALYYYPTNQATDPNSPLDFYNTVYWSSSVQTKSFSNTTAFVSTNYVANTNQTFDIVFSQESGNSIYLDNLSVSEWYADTKTNGGWIAFDSWIEPSLKTGMVNCCRFDPTRAPPGTNQFVQTPLLTNGIYSFSFQYCGATTNPVSFTILISYGDPNTFTNVLDSVTNQFNGSGSDYATYPKTLKDSSTNIYLRFKSTTAAPGILLMDDFNITPYVAGDTWYINNAAIDGSSQTHPPGPRQFYAGACYLNSNRTANASPTDAPDTNEMPNVRSPAIDGVGEISFWYRNWATSGAATPAKLLVQSSPPAPYSWTNLYTITNVVNTTDYLFFQQSVYNTNRSVIRICNDDTYTTAVGRVCLDEILVTTPMACSIAVSNMVTTPTIPLFSNTVKVAADVYHSFLSPSNLTLTAYYGTATTYAALSSASVASLAMTCIASNLGVSGQWYRYETPVGIPTNASDTFVKYYVRADFNGYHSEVTSPLTNRQFTVTPAWYRPFATTGMPYYIVFSCPTGSVWINEFNINDWTYFNYEYQFVELCGKAGVDIRTWTLQVLDSLAHTQTVYSITNGTTFANTTNGFGFWVLGKTIVPGIQQTLATNLPTAGGLRLMRISGAMADAVCYTLDGGWNPGGVSALTNQGFTYAGYDDDAFDASVMLTGINTNGFTWATPFSDAGFSPGQANDGQFFFGVTQNAPPPTVSILCLWLNTNVWIECTGTNNWVPTPWYSTNLLNTNLWTNVVTFWSTYPTLSASNTFTVHFSPSTNNPVFYKIVATNAP